MNFRKEYLLLIGGIIVSVCALGVTVFGLLSGSMVLNSLFDQQESITQYRIRGLGDYVGILPTSPPATQPEAVSNSDSPLSAAPTEAEVQAPAAAAAEVQAPAAAAAELQPAAAAPAAGQAQANAGPVANQPSTSSDTAAAAVAPAATSPALVAASVAEATPASSSIISPIATPTATPTPTTTPTATATPSQTPTASPTLPPAPGGIAGRVLVDGAPAGGVILKLEDQGFQTIAQTTVSGDGSYSFTDLPASSQGYTLVFAQEWNSQFDIEQVVSWSWLGPVAVQNGTVAEIPDFDVSLLGFAQTQPAPNASYSSGEEILFEWTAYPDAGSYWVDLLHNEGQAPIWSSSSQSTSVSFNGTLDGGGQIQPGEYWWGVGTQRQLGPYKLVVYGYLPVLVIEP